MATDEGLVVNTTTSMEVIPSIQSLIYVTRGKQVMLDSDLAMLYQVETKNLNKAMKRNEKRFPEEFCFQLSKEEYRFRGIGFHRGKDFPLAHDFSCKV